MENIVNDLKQRTESDTTSESPLPYSDMSPLVPNRFSRQKPFRPLPCSQEFEPEIPDEKIDLEESFFGEHLLNSTKFASVGKTLSTILEPKFSKRQESPPIAIEPFSFGVLTEQNVNLELLNIADQSTSIKEARQVQQPLEPVNEFVALPDSPKFSGGLQTSVSQDVMTKNSQRNQEIAPFKKAHSQSLEDSVIKEIKKATLPDKDVEPLHFSRRSESSSSS